ncbi:hypothetical protein ACFYNY_30030 [Streptomyces sp. NPDC006530]|uniref:hypothetical protein n=1 Tax=Streptomyces sp. NPDC006530 TaxID=3364750 RepID=UPI0036859FBB
MGWDEWEQLKTAAAERHSTQMRLNASSPSQSGSGDKPELRHSDKPWTHAASVAHDLAEDAASDMRELTRAHENIPRATVGLSCVAKLSSVLESWDLRIAAIREECGTLELALRQVAVDLGELDTKAQRQMDSIRETEVRQGS